MSAREWKQFILAWVIVALCAIPVMVWGQSLSVGKSDGNTYSIPSCDTAEQIMDVVTQPNPEAVRARFLLYNNLMVNGEPACGRIEAEIVVLDVVKVITMGDSTVTVIRFQPQGYPKPVYGVTTFRVANGTSV